LTLAEPTAVIGGDTGVFIAIAGQDRIDMGGPGARPWIREKAISPKHGPDAQGDWFGPRRPDRGDEDDPVSIRFHATTLSFSHIRGPADQVFPIRWGICGEVLANIHEGIIQRIRLCP